jgi:hypothetical protein
MKVTTPATPSTLSLVKRAITLKMALAKMEALLKPITEELKLRAKEDTVRQIDTKSGGKSWTMGDDQGRSVVVSFPVAKRIAIEDPALLQGLCGKLFRKFFPKTTSYKGIEDLEAKITAAFTPAKAEKILAAATEASSPTIKFELKEGA